MRVAWCLACLACSSSTDVAAVVFDEVETTEVSADGAPWPATAAQEDSAAVMVTGRPTPNHPFAVQAWPLEIGLEQFFGEEAAPNGRRVRVEGADAVALLGLLEAGEREVSPSGRVVAVEDDAGALYLLVIQTRAHLDD